MAEENRGDTLNICLGHLPFPREFHAYIDLMLAPCELHGSCQVVVVDDGYLGEHGSSLSEYVQLLWLYDNFDTVVGSYDYVRIFHYRRFVAHKKIGGRSNREYARWIHKDRLRKYPEEFSRISNAEVFNTPCRFPGGVLGQYASDHIVEDILNFAKFSLESGVLDAKQTESFLSGEVLIPAPNMGIFRSTTLREILMILRHAAEFLETPYFIPRSGYQRRTAGFLLERLNSYLILARIKSGLSEANFGHHIVLSDGPLLGNTNEALRNSPFSRLRYAFPRVGFGWLIKILR